MGIYCCLSWDGDHGMYYISVLTRRGKKAWQSLHLDLVMFFNWTNVNNLTQIVCGWSKFSYSYFIIDTSKTALLKDWLQGTHYVGTQTMSILQNSSINCSCYIDTESRLILGWRIYTVNSSVAKIILFQVSSQLWGWHRVQEAIALSSWQFKMMVITHKAAGNCWNQRKPYRSILFPRTSFWYWIQMVCCMSLVFQQQKWAQELP